MGGGGGGSGGLLGASVHMLAEDEPPPDEVDEEMPPKELAPEDEFAAPDELLPPDDDDDEDEPPPPDCTATTAGPPPVHAPKHTTAATPVAIATVNHVVCVRCMVRCSYGGVSPVGQHWLTTSPEPPCSLSRPGPHHIRQPADGCCDIGTHTHRARDHTLPTGPADATPACPVLPRTFHLRQREPRHRIGGNL